MKTTILTLCLIGLLCLAAPAIADDPPEDADPLRIVDCSTIIVDPYNPGVYVTFECLPRT